MSTIWCARVTRGWHAEDWTRTPSNGTRADLLGVHPTQSGGHEADGRRDENVERNGGRLLGICADCITKNTNIGIIRGTYVVI